MNTKSMSIAVGVAAVALLAGACSIDVERNADGSLQVDAVISEESLATELERDPQNENVVVDIRTGFLLVTTDRTDVRGVTSAVAFRADLGVSDDHLTVTVSDATFDGFPIPDSLVEQWNEGLATAIERAARRHPDASLQAVDLAGDELALEWRVDTPASKDS